MYPQYSVYLAEGLKFIMSAKKMAMTATSNYRISSSETDFDENSDKYAANLVSNFSGSIFNLYDGGFHPDTAISKYPNSCLLYTS